MSHQAKSCAMGTFDIVIKFTNYVSIGLLAALIGVRFVNFGPTVGSEGFDKVPMRK